MARCDTKSTAHGRGRVGIGGATYVWRCVICAVTEWALANTGYHDPLVISGGAVRLVVLVVVRAVGGAHDIACRRVAGRVGVAPASGAREGSGVL